MGKYYFKLLYAKCRPKTHETGGYEILDGVLVGVIICYRRERDNTKVNFVLRDGRKEVPLL